MSDLRVPQWRLLVLANGDTPQHRANARGHLFEVFVATLLKSYGYASLDKQVLQHTSDGIEIDVWTKRRLDGEPAMAECKAYNRPVAAHEVTNFLGKLIAERYESPQTVGILAVIPKLTADGEEKARTIAANDDRFHYWPAAEMVSRLEAEELIVDRPTWIAHSSDPSIVVTEDGIFAATLELDSTSREPIQVVVWAATGQVPPSTLSLLADDEYSTGLSVVDGSSTRPTDPPAPIEGQVLVTVQSSREDFQYQLPASPKFFIGRRTELEDMADLLESGEKTFVFNAQSGWGKSSLALKFADIVAGRRGVTRVMDTRTASSPRYVIDVLHEVATEAERIGLVQIPADASWATLASAIETLQRAEWVSTTPKILIFFDQFENVFRFEELTRAFRDLALSLREGSVPILVGFAWKTDMVGWVEGHPYYLRDEIRSNAAVVIVQPFGSREVTTLLDRLERRIHMKLGRDLRSRLREYSQGLPWLLKKLADHVLQELKRGTTQEQLLSGALNVASLFKNDLAELDPNQNEILRHVARYAPIPAGEVTDKYSPEAVQSLVDRRLLVQVGDRLDTYWDIFRDFLNTGNVPIEDSYIMRQTPGAVARILPMVVEAGGSLDVRTISAALDTSDNAIFNLSRELRLLGLASYEPLTVNLLPEIIASNDPEEFVREAVQAALRRHRAYTILRDLADKSGNSGVAAETFALALPAAFPAVSVKESTWRTYAMTFLNWFEYAGLVILVGGRWQLAQEGVRASNRQLLSARPGFRVAPSVPMRSWGPSKAFLMSMAGKESVELDPADRKTRDAVRTLAALGLVRVSSDLVVRLTPPELVTIDGQISEQILRRQLKSVPGGEEALAHLAINASATSREVGEIIRTAVSAAWSDETSAGVGGHFRGWAKGAGVAIVKAPRRT